jgi:hypothetical protein
MDSMSHRPLQRAVPAVATLEDMIYNLPRAVNVVRRLHEYYENFAVDDDEERPEALAFALDDLHERALKLRAAFQSRVDDPGREDVFRHASTNAADAA